MGVVDLVPFCDTPFQSVVAAVVGGVVGGLVGLGLGLPALGTALLAGVVGGLADLSVHVARGDDQFTAARVRTIRALRKRVR